jgi:hypothetical protein
MYIDTQWQLIHIHTKITVTLMMPKTTATHTRSSTVLVHSWAARCL